MDSPRLEENDRLDVIVDEEEDEEVGCIGRVERHRRDWRGMELVRVAEVRTRFKVGADREMDDMLRRVDI